ncbi:MAG: hypothetical protein K0Q94_6021, partial [Paenibacillus sp.]|nr:hypothetical protein [Paenibacillus sp.]
MDGNSSLERIVRKLEEAAKGTFWEQLGCELEHVEPGKAVVAL